MRITKIITNFILPRFLPIDLYTFIILIFTSIVISHKAIFDFLVSGTESVPITVFYTVLILLLLLITLLSFLDFVFSKKTISYDQRKKFSKIFYLVSSIVFIGAGIVGYYTREDGLFATLQFGIILFLILRSVLSLIALWFIEEHKLHHIPAAQIMNEKPHKNLLGIIIILSLGIYSIVIQNNTILVTISLTYFYIGLIVEMLRNIFPSLSLALRNE